MRRFTLRSTLWSSASGRQRRLRVILEEPNTNRGLLHYPEDDRQATRGSITGTFTVISRDLTPARVREIAKIAVDFTEDFTPKKTHRQLKYLQGLVI